MIELIKALVQFQSEAKDAPANTKNPFFNSDYADLESILKTIRPLLAKNGFAVSQVIVPRESDMMLKTVLYHVSGNSIESLIPIKADMAKPQAVASAITYARRYSLASIVGICDTDPDDDGNTAQKNPPQKDSDEPQKKKTITLDQVKEIESLIASDAKLLSFAYDKLSAGKLQNFSELPVNWFKPLMDAITKEKEKFAS